jgi:hypothetical protein
MLTRADKWRAIYLGLVYVAFAELSSLGATSRVYPCILISQYQSSNNQSSYQSCTALHEGIARLLVFSWAYVTHDNVIAASTVIVAVFTVTLWFSTYELWMAGERHSERELRAYIVGTTSAQYRNLSTPSPYSILSFKNSGKTPAFDVRVWTTSAVAVYPMNERPSAPRNDPGYQSSVGVVGPGADFHNEIASDIVVTPPEHAEVIAGRAAFYIYGEIAYRDSFGIERTASFCHFTAGPKAQRNDGPLATYYKWNEAT